MDLILFLTLHAEGYITQGLYSEWTLHVNHVKCRAYRVFLYTCAMVLTHWQKLALLIMIWNTIGVFDIGDFISASTRYNDKDFEYYDHYTPQH
jgi:hypothetical protein